jgi:hypothetical protein
MPDDGFASGKVIEKLTAGEAVFQIEKKNHRRCKGKPYFIYPEGDGFYKRCYFIKVKKLCILGQKQ